MIMASSKDGSIPAVRAELATSLSISLSSPRIFPELTITSDLVYQLHVAAKWLVAHTSWRTGSMTRPVAKSTRQTTYTLFRILGGPHSQSVLQWKVMSPLIAATYYRCCGGSIGPPGGPFGSAEGPTRRSLPPLAGLPARSWRHG